jgi:hypothetical protein
VGPDGQATRYRTFDAQKPALRSRPATRSQVAEVAAAAPAGRTPLWRQVEQEEAARWWNRARVVREPRLPGHWQARYGAVHDIDGPRVRMGLLWLVVVGVALAIGLPAVTVVFAVVGALAAHQVARAWEPRNVEADPWVAAGAAALMVVAGAVDLRWVGAAVLVAVLAALAVAQMNARRHSSVYTDAGHTLLAVVPVGLVGACVATNLRYDDLGACAVLLAFTLAYDAGDFLVGTGSPNAYEGPLAGWLAIAAATMVVVVLHVPPFRGAPTWEFAALAALTCPLGQVAASAILPSSHSSAPALRRLDSLLVLAPVYTFAIGIFLQHHH